MSAHEEVPAAVRGEVLKALVEGYRDRVPRMCAEAEATLMAELPEVVARLPDSLRLPATEASFVRAASVLAGLPEPPDARQIHVAQGAAAARAGVPLAKLTAAYRIGSRIAWGHLSELAHALDVDAAVVLQLAAGHAAYADLLAEDAAEGHALVTTQARETLRTRENAVLDAVLRGEPAPSHARLPERVAVAVLLTANDRTGPTHTDVILGAFEGTPLALGAPAAMKELEVACAVGPAVLPADAAYSLARARELAALVAAGALPSPPGRPLLWEDHLPTVIAHADAGAAAALVTRRLAPLHAAPEARRRLLRDTLRAWLDHPGQPLAIARRLQLHPQSVRYRLARLREVLGDDALDDPATRLELQLALLAETASPDR